MKNHNCMPRRKAKMAISEQMIRLPFSFSLRESFSLFYKDFIFYVRSIPYLSREQCPKIVQRCEKSCLFLRTSSASRTILPYSQGGSGMGVWAGLLKTIGVFSSESGLFTFILGFCSAQVTMDLSAACGLTSSSGSSVSDSHSSCLSMILHSKSTQASHSSSLSLALMQYCLSESNFSTSSRQCPRKDSFLFGLMSLKTMLTSEENGMRRRSSQKRAIPLRSIGCSWIRRQLSSAQWTSHLAFVGWFGCCVSSDFIVMSMRYSLFVMRFIICQRMINSQAGIQQANISLWL